MIDRRKFVKSCVVAGAGVIVGPSLSRAFTRTSDSTKFELASVVGDRYFENTLKAVNELGGMQKFVRKGNTVGMLINNTMDNAGTFTNPDISLAVLAMCVDAGARQIFMIHPTSRRYWQRSAFLEKLRSEVEGLQYSDETIDVKIDRGKSLKTATISKCLMTCDVFINIPIIKDHKGTKYTCTMKNMMGGCSGSTCQRIHFGDSPGLLNMFKGYYSNVELLSQSIADVNLARQPDLCVVDATVILATNGPSGPGELRTPREVIAATNCVAADMYATRHLGLNWEDLLVIRYAQQHGYGPRSLKDVQIKAE